MIDLYGMGSPNVLKVILMLEETGLAYRLHYVDVWRGAQFAPDFSRLNPNAKVPVLIDPDVPQPVFESGAILIYLAEKTGRFLPGAGPARYAALQWLMLQVASVGPNFGQCLHFSRFAPEPNPYGRARFGGEAARLVRVVDKRLAEQPYLGGESYSIADIATYPWFSLLAYLGLSSVPAPHVERWLAAIAQRPAAQRLQTKVAEIAPLDKAARKAATTADLERFFGRAAGDHA